MALSNHVEDGEIRATPVNSRRLKATLVLIDLVGAVVVWSAVLWSSPQIHSGEPATRLILGITLLVAVVLASTALQRLYRSRVCAVREVETSRLLRVGLVTAAVGVVSLHRLGVPVSAGRVVLGSIVLVAALGMARSVFAAWLQMRRSAGDYSRPMVMVGTNDEAGRLERLIALHPEFGYRLCGVIADPPAGQQSKLRAPLLGSVVNTVAIAEGLHAGVLIAVTSVDSAVLGRLIRDLTNARIIVHASSGLTRVDQRRIRLLPLAREPMFYIEATPSSTVQDISRRTIDVVVSVVGLLLLSPLIALAALAVKLDSRGPVLFRQERIGRGRKEFDILKLRTMTNGAEQQLLSPSEVNERRDGPLFKMKGDPRVTRVGKWLRALSVDELPQLINVVRGEMSLVGPRPPLPQEANEFDAELMNRFSVRPGITGLWQLDARDNPAFDAYRRLDLFYVENRSVGMDLAIIWGTIGVVVSHALHCLRTLSRNAEEASLDVGEMVAIEDGLPSTHEKRTPALARERPLGVGLTS